MLNKKLKAILLGSSLCVLANGLAAQQEEAMVRVQAAPISDLVVYPQMSIAAQVVSLNHATISAQANAEILAVNAQVGDTVAKGDELVALDCEQRKLDVAAAQSAYNLAKKDAGRFKQLAAGNAIAKQQLNQAQTNQEQAGVRLQKAKVEIKNCSVKAPYNGVITAREAQLGSLAVVGMPLFRLLDVTNVEAKASLPPSMGESITQAKGLQFIAAGQSYPATIRTWLPYLNEANNQQEIRLRFSGKRPIVGASGQLEWQEVLPHLPAQYLVERDGGLGYFTIEENTAKFVPLQEAQLGKDVPVEVDLISVITQGRYGVNDGDAVELMQP